LADLTETDRTILRLMQENARTRLDEITEQAGASAATVQRRIKHLRRSGVISGEVAVVDPEEAGFAMTFLILVELERESLHQLDGFRRKTKAEPQIQQCYYITGDADFALIALARNMKDYEALTQRLFFADSNVKRFRTCVVMDRTKVGMTVPI
jgi:Lrp/AsnC family leucine-responsive transcriptional regulator